MSLQFSTAGGIPLDSLRRINEPVVRGCGGPPLRVGFDGSPTGLDPVRLMRHSQSTREPSLPQPRTGIALAFFRESLRDTAERSKESGRRAPPDVFGVGAMATENGTRGVAQRRCAGPGAAANVED